jgi:hypothetical protein
MNICNLMAESIEESKMSWDGRILQNNVLKPKIATLSKKKNLVTRGAPEFRPERS